MNVNSTVASNFHAQYI